MTLGAGEVFAGYAIVRQLGSGGMGEVYLAKHPRLPRHEALKILRPDISTDDTFRARFVREADSIAALEHPNILTIFDRGDYKGQLWIATQYINGTDAAQLLRDSYPAGMPADEALTVITAIAEALDYAHDSGLVHRDVKPANLLLSLPDRLGVRRIYLADFGIARPLDDPSGLTATNFTLGTVAYSAPEQLEGHTIDGRADQYALAATAFHLMTGLPPYPDANPIAVISRHLTRPAPAPSSIRPELAALDPAFARALAKSPYGRFPRCMDFAQALARAASETGIGFPASADTLEAPVALPPKPTPPKVVIAPPPKPTPPEVVSSPKPSLAIIPPSVPSKAPATARQHLPREVDSDNVMGLTYLIQDASPLKDSAPQHPPPPQPPRTTRLDRADLIEFIAALQSALKFDAAAEVSSYEKRLTRLKGDFFKRHAEAVAAGNEPGAVVDLSFARIQELGRAYQSEYDSQPLQQLLTAWKKRASRPS